MIYNGQTVIDSGINPEMGGKTVVTINQPVMERLTSGRSKGLALLPLGYISASFYARELLKYAPRLHFNLYK